MTGYLEVLTDPFYAGQAVTMQWLMAYVILRYPLIGWIYCPKELSADVTWNPNLVLAMIYGWIYCREKFLMNTYDYDKSNLKFCPE